MLYVGEIAYQMRYTSLDYHSHLQSLVEGVYVLHVFSMFSMTLISIA
jgi:hypothetical protein